MILLDAMLPSLSAWENFYIITGPSGAALLGLQFVVVALIKETPSTPAWGVGTFTSPTLVHFGSVLAVAAILSAPWPSLPSAALALGAYAVATLGYALVVVWRLSQIATRSDRTYNPVLEDWIFHAVLPVGAYALMLAAALLLPAHAPGALFTAAAVVVVLLFTGIHNAWDIATYLTLQLRSAPRDADAGDAGDITASAPSEREM
jgi:hypothetical protein